MEHVTRLLRTWLIFTAWIQVLDLWPQNPSRQYFVTLGTKRDKVFRSRMKVWGGGRIIGARFGLLNEGGRGDCSRHTYIKICNHTWLKRIRSGRRLNCLSVTLARRDISQFRPKPNHRTSRATVVIRRTFACKIIWTKRAILVLLDVKRI
jgi:hypothetical protein